MAAPGISESEWIIMEALWNRAPQTASEVAEVVRDSTGWADNTVRTMLTRLIGKNAVGARRSATGVREFLPAVRREDCVLAESRSFLTRVFRGSAKPLLAHFAENANLSPDEVQELKRLLYFQLNHGEQSLRRSLLD